MTKAAAGIICAGGTLGILIPPSIMLIVYAAIAELSPLRLYAAAVFPGLLLAGLYIVYVIVRVKINPSLAPMPAKDDIPPRGVVYYNLLISFVPLTVLILLVLGSIWAVWQHLPKRRPWAHLVVWFWLRSIAN